MERNSFWKRAALGVVILSAIALAGSFGAAKVEAASAQYGSCHEVSVPVALKHGQTASQTVRGTFCTPLIWAAAKPHTADILVHGATYNRTYWDWPQNPALYSYVDQTLQAGRATFNYDRLGTGTSSKPPGTQLSIENDAYVLHQLITWVRGQEVAQVNGIGHSLGSLILSQEAAQHQDIDRLVFTGILHSPALGRGAAVLLTSLYPTALDPAFLLKSSDLTYLTTMPGRRGPSFYSSTAEPSLIAYDEAHKDIITATELTTAFTSAEVPAPLNITRNIVAPIYIVMGAEDNLFCNLLVSCEQPGHLLANEAPYFTGARSLEAAIIPDTGHNLTLHPSASVSFGVIDTWLNSH